MGKLRIDLRPGESISIGNDAIVVTMEEKSGQVARLTFDADRNIPIRRTDQVASIAAQAGIGRNKTA